MTLAAINCEYCKRKTIIKQQTQRFCSQKCRQNGQYHRNVKNILIRKSLRKWNGREKEKEKWNILKSNKKCLICNKALKGSKYKYCSKSCKHRNWYERKWHNYFKYKYALKRNIRDKTRRMYTKHYCCEICGSKERLNIHHISYIPNIIITLCLKCHVKIHKTQKKESG